MNDYDGIKQGTIKQKIRGVSRARYSTHRLCESLEKLGGTAADCTAMIDSLNKVIDKCADSFVTDVRSASTDELRLLFHELTYR